MRGLLLRTFLWISLLLAPLVAASAAQAAAKGQPSRRALLIGVDDYSATRLRRPADAVAPPRDRVWPQLLGAVNDVGILRDMLTGLYRFKRKDIVTLTNQDATRAAIFDAMEKLIASTSKGDIVLFYYAGHGSRVSNSGSEEQDKMDESVLPADSRLGASDIRDKELRRIFNRILDRGARLTVVFDTCFSGSADRNTLFIARPTRGVAPDSRDVRDASKAGPWPSSRGALVLSATDDETTAAETRDPDGKFHGAFSWALFQAVRDAEAGEPAADTFLRARARLQLEMPSQNPVIAGNDEARLNPFLDVRTDRSNGRTVVAVEDVESDGTIVVQGGWANGIAAGSDLEGGGQHLEVTALDGITKCRARVLRNRASTSTAALHAGSLLQVVGWVAPRERPMRVFIPRTSASTATLADSARQMAQEAARRKLKWIDDPTAVMPDFVVRKRESLWELVSPDGRSRVISTAPADLLINIPAGESVYAQLPATEALARDLGIQPESEKAEGVVLAGKPQEADYVLTGRYAAGQLEYAWVRAVGTKRENRGRELPERSDWKPPAAIVLRDLMLRLRRAHGWLSLDSPPGMAWAYTLAVCRTRDGALFTKGILTGGEQYSFVMHARRKTAPPASRRWVYIFSIDSFGRGVLLYPAITGSVENRFPLPDAASPPGGDIPLGAPSNFHTAEPYGTDSYFMLTTVQSLPNPPAVFKFDGARTTTIRGETALEQLLLQVGESTRAAVPIPTPPEWSIERLVFESVPRSSR
jgi:hypothetical protein